MTEPARLVFAGGALRSGLLVLRALLDQHPQISCGPDLRLTPSVALKWRSTREVYGAMHETYHGLSDPHVRAAFAEVIRSVLGERAERDGKRVAVDKTPANVLAFRELAALFPDAQLVHVIRDGRDVVASLLERNWTDPRTGKAYPYTRDAGAAARLWSDMVKAGLDAEASSARQIISMRYEALVTQPQLTLEPLLAGVGVSWSARMPRFPHRRLDLAGTERESAALVKRGLSNKRIGRWRSALDRAQLAQVEAVAGPLLARLGYR